jgi:hypothetical protein
MGQAAEELHPRDHITKSALNNALEQEKRKGGLDALP